MNILLTIHHELDPHTGASGSVLKLGQAYEKLGHEVTYYSFSDLSGWIPKLPKELTFPAFLAAHLLRQHTKHPIDVIDASTGDAWIWGSVLRHLVKNPPLLVTRSHGLEHAVHFQDLEDAALGHTTLSWKYPLYRGGFRLWEVARSLRSADLAFLLNHQDLKYTVEQLGVSPAKAKVCPNGIADTLLNRPLEPIPSAGSPIGIAIVGSYILRKGILYSVPALNALLKRHPHVFVSFLGTCCEPEQIYADFEPSVHEQVHVVPWFEHTTLPTLLKGHQIKLFTPLCEGFGKALIEAMACGLAPVTTAAAGPMEVVQDGHDAIVVPLRDSAAIKAALERLVSNPTLIETIRQNAYKTAQQYSWRRCAQMRLDLYKAALERRNAVLASV